ncbi:MAG: acyltransferase [Sphingopyxis sp.]
MFKIKSLNQLRQIRHIVTGARKAWLRFTTGVDIHPSASLSLSARLICPAPGAIRIGAETLVAFKTLLLADYAPDGQLRPIRIGARCFIGGGAMILPGVSVGDETIVAAGAVVRDDAPARCIVAGNPARIIRRDIVVGRFGRLAGADDNSRRMWRL